MGREDPMSQRLEVIDPAAAPPVWAALRNEAYAVDVASRVRFLARQDREEVRQFMLKYSERVLYATDYSPGAGNDEGAARSFLSTHEQEWSFFASGELLRFRDREVRGLALPAKVLRRIFHENAVRWLRMS